MTNSHIRFGAAVGVVLLLALGFGYLFFLHEQRLALGVWPGYALDDVQSIEVETPRRGYLLLREEGEWVVRLAGSGTDVPPVLADASRIESLLAAIARNRPTQTAEAKPGAGLSGFGFRHPALRIKVTPAARGLHPVEYLLGRGTPTGAALYAYSSLAPETAFILDASVLQQLDRPAEHYFDTRLLDVRGEDAQHLTLYGPTGAQWELDRGRDEQFMFLKPESMRNAAISASEVRLYLQTLAAITADVILTKPAQQAAGRPACVIEVRMLKSQTPQRLELYAPLDAAQVFGRSTRHPLGFLLDRDKARTLVRQAYDMQWRGIIAFDSAQVEGARMDFAATGRILMAEKTADGWVDRALGRKLPGIDMSLWRLKELRFEGAPTNRLGPPARKRLALALLGRDGRALATFTFFVDPRLPADQCWLQVGADEMYYPVTSQLLEDMQGFLPPSPAPVDPDKPTAAGQSK